MPPRTVAVIMFIVLALPASAQPGFEAKVDLLDSTSLAQREQATAGLIADDTIELGDIEKLLVAGDLTPEKRLRLEGVGLTLFARMPRAGLGVQFGRPIEGGGAPLNGVVPGFPAAEILRPGDFVWSINGLPVINTGHMGAIILSHSPGDTLRLEIDRPMGPIQDPAEPPPVERITLDVPLGRYLDLNNGSPTPGRIEAAFQQHLSRAAAQHEPAVIGDGLSPLAWLRAEGYDDREIASPSSVMQHVAAWRVLAFGGQPSSSISNIELRRGDESAMLRRTNSALQADGIYDQIEETLAAYRVLVRRLGEIREWIDKSLAGDDRADAQNTRRLERIRTERVEIEAELDMIIRLLEQRHNAGEVSP